MSPAIPRKPAEKPRRLTPPQIPFEVRFGMSREELKKRLEKKGVSIVSFADFLRVHGLRANMRSLDLYISSLTGRL